MARIKSAKGRQTRRVVRASMLVLAFVGTLAYYTSKNDFGTAELEIGGGSGVLCQPFPQVSASTLGTFNGAG